jgi:hypothetical protein
VHSRIAFVLAVLSILLATASPVVAACVQLGGRYTRIGSGAVSDSSPSIVLGITPDRDVRGGEPEPTSLSLAGRPLALTTLAPGLLVARSSTAIPTGSYVLLGLASPLAVTTATTATTTTTTLPAPQVLSIEVRRVWHVTEAVADLVTPPPAGAVAVVVTSGGTPTAWAPIVPSRSEVVVGEIGCGYTPDGYRLPTADDDTRLLWVDAEGRLSPPSSSAVVRVTPRR